MAEKDNHVILTAHHPLKSTGEHGGYFGLKAHLFPLAEIHGWDNAMIPLPGLGSIYPLFRMVGLGTPQDISNSKYNNIKTKIEKVLKETAKQGAAPLMFAAGHDHSLQVFDKDKNSGTYHIVSGLGSSNKASTVWHNDQTLFAHSNKEHAGFMAVDFLTKGDVQLSVFETVNRKLMLSEPDKLYKTVFTTKLIPGH